MYSVSIKSNAGRVIAALAKTKSDLSKGMIQAMRHEAAGLQAHVVRDYLSGQSLNRRTGALSRSIHFGNETFILGGDQFRGMSIDVGTNIIYGRYHELGFHGVEHVRPFTRRIPNRSIREGVERISKKTGRPYRASIKTAEGIAFVHAFDRTVNYAGHPFLLPAYEDSAETIAQHIGQAAIRAFQENQVNE